MLADSGEVRARSEQVVSTMMKSLGVGGLLGMLVLGACSSKDTKSGGNTAPPEPTNVDTARRDGAIDAPVEPNPTAPASDGGNALAWVSAREIQGIKYLPNRDSVIIQVPAVDG